MYFKWCPAQHWTCITKLYNIKNLHSSGKIHCLETSNSAHRSKNTTCFHDPLCHVQRQNSSLFPHTAVLPFEKLICPAIASTGRKRDHFFLLFSHYTFLRHFLNSPSPYIWAIQTLCSRQPALNNARKLADGCWQQARLCPHSAPVTKQKTSGDASANWIIS